MCSAKRRTRWWRPCRSTFGRTASSSTPPRRSAGTCVCRRARCRGRRRRWTMPWGGMFSDSCRKTAPLRRRASTGARPSPKRRWFSARMKSTRAARAKAGSRSTACGSGARVRCRPPCRSATRWFMPRTHSRAGWVSCRARRCEAPRSRSRRSTLGAKATRSSPCSAISRPHFAGATPRAGRPPPRRSTRIGSRAWAIPSNDSSGCGWSFRRPRIRAWPISPRHRAGAGSGRESRWPSMPEITARSVDAAAFARLVAQGCDPRLARLYAARGLTSVEELSTALKALASPDRLHHVDDAARLLADSIASKERLLIVADYDADGATACAVGVKALRAMGASVEYLVPNRFEHGYGLTPEIVQEAAKRSPDLLITVDNGIAAVEGIAEANRLGMRVLVTDHHLPAAEIPAAACIVNPNQAGCGFPSKHLAGVGVIFYVMLALRAELRRRGTFSPAPPEPQLAGRLDLAALGTAADVVPLAASKPLLLC